MAADQTMEIDDLLDESPEVVESKSQVTSKTNVAQVHFKEAHDYVPEEQEITSEPVESPKKIKRKKKQPEEYKTPEQTAEHQALIQKLQAYLAIPSFAEYLTKEALIPLNMKKIVNMPLAELRSLHVRVQAALANRHNSGMVKTLTGTVMSVGEAVTANNPRFCLKGWKEIAEQNPGFEQAAAELEIEYGFSALIGTPERRFGLMLMQSAFQAIKINSLINAQQMRQQQTTAAPPPPPPPQPAPLPQAPPQVVSQTPQAEPQQPPKESIPKF